MDQNGKGITSIVIGQDKGKVGSLQTRLSHFANQAKLQVLGSKDSYDHPTRIQIAIWMAILCLMILVSLNNYQSYQLGTHFDDSRYVVLARSLIHSRTYGMINVPGEPNPGKYPFGYPLLLVPVLILFPNNLHALNVPSLLATILNVSLLFWGWHWFCRWKSYWWGLGITALYAFAPMSIDHTRRVMSEPFFFFFCLVVILLTEQYASGKRVRWWSIYMAVGLTFAVFTRSIGIVLMAGVFIYLLFIKGWAFWKELARILAPMTILVSLIVILTPVQLKDLLPLEYLKDENARYIISALTPGDTGKSSANSPTPSSVQPVPSMVQSRVLTSLRELLVFGFKQHFGKDIRVVALSIGGGWREQDFALKLNIPNLPSIIGYLVSGVVILGMIRLFKQNPLSFFLLFAVLYFGAIFLWVWNDTRLLYPIHPQIQMGFLSGLEAMMVLITMPLNRKNQSSSLRNALLTFLVILLILTSMYKSFRITDSRAHAGDLQARSNWFLTNSDPSAIIMSEAPETDFIYSGRKTITYPLSLQTASQLEGYLMRNGVNYILIAPVIQWQLNFQPIYSEKVESLFPMLDELSSQQRVKLVFSSDQEHLMIFQVNPN